MKRTIALFALFISLIIALNSSIVNAQTAETGAMKLNSLGYLEYQVANVMLALDFYPESHRVVPGHQYVDLPGTDGLPFRF